MTVYDVSSYVLWAVFGLLAIISIIFLTGHGVSLIAGYNTASKEELMKLPGLGESKANSIIEQRQKKGDFKSVEEIKEVSGIGESIFEKIKDYITV